MQLIKKWIAVKRRKRCLTRRKKVNIMSAYSVSINSLYFTIVFARYRNSSPKGELINEDV